MHNPKGCTSPVGAADNKQSFLRAERLAMVGKARDLRSQISRARDGMHNPKGCSSPVGATDNKRSFLRAERLAMDGKTGDLRSQKSRARDGNTTMNY